MFAIEPRSTDSHLISGERSAGTIQALIDTLALWLREERRKLSTKNPVAKPIDYSLKQWSALTRFLVMPEGAFSTTAASA
jgi:Transposase IS66 family